MFSFSQWTVVSPRKTANKTYTFFFYLWENKLHHGIVEVANKILNRQQLATKRYVVVQVLAGVLDMQAL